MYGQGNPQPWLAGQRKQVKLGSVFGKTLHRVPGLTFLPIFQPIFSIYTGFANTLTPTPPPTTLCEEDVSKGV